MASTNTLNNQDVTAQQYNNQPQFNAFSGLQKTFQQQQPQAQQAPTPGNATQGLQSNVAKAQNTASQGGVQAGQQQVASVNQQTSGFTPQAYTVGGYTGAQGAQAAASAIGANPGVGATGAQADINTNIPNELAAAQQALQNAATVNQNQFTTNQQNIENTQVNNTNALSQLQQNIQQQLVNAPTALQATATGQQNALEQRAAQQNQVLGATTNDQAAKLTALFNPGYNASRYAGFDAGLYNQQINAATQQAQQMNQQTAAAAAQQQAAMTSYNNAQQLANTNLGNYVNTEGITLGNQENTAALQNQQAYNNAENALPTQAQLMADYNNAQNAANTALTAPPSTLTPDQINAAGNAYLQANPELAAQLQQSITGQLPNGFTGLQGMTTQGKYGIAQQSAAPATPIASKANTVGGNINIGLSPFNGLNNRYNR